MNTKDELTVMWLESDGHSEELGMYVYAYFPVSSQALSEDALNSLGNCTFAKSKSSKISIENGLVTTTTIKVDNWPDDDGWTAYLQELFSFLVGHGAAVVWAGGEDCSWTLDTLDPEMSDGNVYAGYSPKTGLVYNSRLTEEIVFLTDEQIATLGGCISSSP